MIPKIIHLIWLGDHVDAVDAAIQQHRELNPQHEVRLHRDDTELNPEYRWLYDNIAKLPALKSDLLRWSLLEKYGGWYFDIDIVPRVGVEAIEKQLGLDGSRMLITRRGPLPHNDILAVGRNWPHWDRVHEYLRNYRPIKNGDAVVVFYACFSADLVMKAIIGKDGRDTERIVPGPDIMFDYNNPLGWAYRQPFQQPAKLQLGKYMREDRPKLADKAAALFAGFGKYASAIRQWIEAGMPERSDKEVTHIYNNICRVCPWFSNDRCTGCGCKIRGTETFLARLLSKFKARSLVNKIRMKTEHCPKHRW